MAVSERIYVCMKCERIKHSEVCDECMGRTLETGWMETLENEEKSQEIPPYN